MVLGDELPRTSQMTFKNGKSKVKGENGKASTNARATRARSRRRTCRGGCDRSPERAHRARGCSLPSTSSPLIDGQFEVSALSGGSVGRLCGSGGRVLSGDRRSPVFVCVFSGRLRVLRLWVSGVPDTGFRVSPSARASERLVVGLRCRAVFVRVSRSTRLLRQVPPLVRSRSLSFDLNLTRVFQVDRRCLLRTRLWCDAHATAARSAL